MSFFINFKEKRIACAISQQVIFGLILKCVLLISLFAVSLVAAQETSEIITVAGDAEIYNAEAITVSYALPKPYAKLHTEVAKNVTPKKRTVKRYYSVAAEYRAKKSADKKKYKNLLPEAHNIDLSRTSNQKFSTGSNSALLFLVPSAQYHGFAAIIGEFRIRLKADFSVSYKLKIFHAAPGISAGCPVDFSVRPPPLSIA